MERMEGIVSSIAERLLTVPHLFAQNPRMELETFVDLSLAGKGAETGFRAPSSPAQPGPGAKWSAAQLC
jgi:hypothetical protein